MSFPRHKSTCKRNSKPRISSPDLKTNNAIFHKRNAATAPISYAISAELYKPISDELNTIKFKGKRDKFQTEHNSELTMFYMAKRVLKEVGLKEKELNAELEQLTKEVAKKEEEQRTCYYEVQELSRIAHHVREGQRKKESDIFAGRRKQYEI